jgi:hypothetical protein
MGSFDWPHRYWPRAQDTGAVQGEWELTVRGSEDDFVEAHKALFHAGFWIREDPRYDVYCKKELTDVNNMIDIWTLSFDETDVVFETESELIGYLQRTVQGVDAGESVDFSIGRDEMTQEEYDGLQEFDL